MPDEIVFIDNPQSVTFSVDREKRTIRGRALPFGDVGNGWRFTAGVLTWADKIKVLDGHDWTRAFGLAGLVEADGGIDAVINVARGARGDEMLTLAEDGVYDGMSVGLAAGVGYELDDDGIYNATSGTIAHLGLTPIPAFENAKVTSVAASAAPINKEKHQMPEDEKVFSAAQGVALAEQVTTLEAQIKALGDIKAPAAAGQQFDVREESIYRFAGSEAAPSGFDFATDLLAAAVRDDQAALERIKTFTAEQADEPRNFVSTANVGTINQPAYKPDMFLGQAPVPTSPLYDTFHKGGLSDITPFFYSKLDRAATTVAVADHVEGVEPALTNLVTAVGATVTPQAVSGRVHITREVGDQGGNPSISGLVWAEFNRSHAIALENRTAALIQAQMATIVALTAAIPAGATGQVAGEALEGGLVGLQFLADGTRFTRGFGHVDLYQALTKAVLPATGEKVYPIINPQNRNGITGDKYAFIEVGGYRFNPAWSLGATSAAASNSLIADPTAVHVWNSGLQRLEKLQEKVEGWDIGCFGYFAGIVYDVSGLRKIAYDPVV
jgi:hypothetical protein